MYLKLLIEFATVAQYCFTVIASRCIPYRYGSQREPGVSTPFLTFRPISEILHVK